MSQTGTALQGIVSKVAEIDTLVSEIAASAQEQATGLTQVNTAVNQMDQVTQQNAAMVEQSTAASHSLRSETAELVRLISRFRVGEGGGEARPRERAGRPTPADARMHAPGANPVAAARARIETYARPARGSTAPPSTN